MYEPKSYHAIMVSSTFTDLRQHRQQVITAIEMRGYHANVMEHDGARADADVIDSSLQFVRDSAVYVGVISRKYGQTPYCPERNPDRLSITELEFNEAMRLRRPILLFLMGENHPVTEADIELDPDRRIKLDAFRERAKRMHEGSEVHRVYTSFNSLEEFSPAAATAIGRLAAYLDIRVESSSAESRRETVLPDQVELIISALPEIDPQLTFVGREDLLRDFNAALAGVLLAGDETEQEPPGTEVRAIWLDGPGGMGKSVFLRRACLEAKRNSIPQPKVALVDFDVFKPDWHRPGQSRLTDPRELFDAIAYRLAKLCGREALAAYWKMRAIVDEAWDQHAELHRQLDDALQHIKINDTVADVVTAHQHDGISHPLAKREEVQAERVRWVEDYLRQQGLWSNDANETRSNIITVRQQRCHFDQPTEDIYDRFARYFAVNAKPAVVRPCGLLADTLQQCLRSLCQSSAVVIALDTCEDIPRRIEVWLRYLFVPLLEPHSKLLLLVGSQHRPLSWLDHVERVRFRNIHLSLSPDGRFSLADIKQALMLSGIDLDEVPDLPAKLLRITAGMPVALAPMIDLYKEDPMMGLDELDEGQADDPDDDRAKERATRIVATRLVRRLESQPDERGSFRDITALAALLNPDLEVLAAFWNPVNPRVKLRELEDRYTLLTGGNVHPEVRRFIREHWRQEPPPPLMPVVRELLGIVEAALMDEEISLSRRAQLRHERLNLLCWLSGEEAFPEAARCLVGSVAAEISPTPIFDIVRELRPIKRRWRSARELFTRNPFFLDSYLPKELLDWVRIQTSGWTHAENANLSLLLALNDTQEKRFENAVAHFEAGIGYFAVNPPLPLKETVVSSYTRAVIKLGQQRVDIAERAVKFLEKVGVERDDDWDHDYYWILHDASMYREAEEYCRRAVNSASIGARPRIFLAHLLGVHLGRLDEAVDVLIRGLESEPKNINFNYFLTDLYERQNKFGDAETAYKNTLDSLFHPGERGRVLADLAKLYLNHLSRPSDARATISEAIAQGSDDADAQRKISEVLLLLKDFDNAESHARRAVELNPELTNIHNLGEVLLDRGKWDEAERYIRQWLTKTSGSWVREHWSSALPVFRKLVAEKRGHDLWQLLQDRDDPHLRVLGRALAGIGDGSTNNTEDTFVSELKRQLTTPDLNTKAAEWPEMCLLSDAGPSAR